MKPELFLDIILIVIGLYLALFKSYFQEKGKNIATSEDIESLTEKIESVKEKFLERNAALKAKLDLLTNLQIGHKTDKKNSLINFHLSFSKWLNMLLEASPILIDDYDDAEINQKLHNYNQAYENVLMAESTLKIYVDDDKLYSLISAVKRGALEHLTTNPMECLIELKQNNFQYKQLDQIANHDEKLAKQKEILEARTTIYKTYRDKMLEGLKKIIKLQNNYEDYLRVHLKEIASE